MEDRQRLLHTLVLTVSKPFSIQTFGKCAFKPTVMTHHRTSNLVSSYIEKLRRKPPRFIDLNNLTL